MRTVADGIAKQPLSYFQQERPRHRARTHARCCWWWFFFTLGHVDKLKCVTSINSRKRFSKVKILIRKVCVARNCVGHVWCLCLHVGFRFIYVFRHSSRARCERERAGQAHIREQSDDNETMPSKHQQFKNALNTQWFFFIMAALSASSRWFMTAGFFPFDYTSIESSEHQMHLASDQIEAE